MLHQDDTPSFHLRATFQTFDLKGAPDGTGAIDELYREPGRWKRTITYRGKDRVAVYDTRLHTHSDPLFEDSFGMGELLDAMWAPIPSSSELPKTDRLDTTPTAIGSLQLSCIVMKSPRVDEKNSKAVAPNKAYCVDSATGLLRITAGHSRSYVS